MLLNQSLRFQAVEEKSENKCTDENTVACHSIISHYIFFLSTVSEATKMTHFSLHNICNILIYAVPYALST